MSSLAAALLGLAIGNTAATAPTVTVDAPTARAPARRLPSLDLRLTERHMPRADSRWRLRELSEPIAEEGRSLVRWGWKKVTLRLPLGAVR